MKKNLMIAVWMTFVTTVLLGVVYPLVLTGLAQILFRDKANGQLITKDGKVIGSHIIGQAFTGPSYFHPRPSAVSYDAANSNGSQFAPTNHLLVDRVKGDVAALQAEHPGQLIPIDLVTTSASGLDPDITPAAAEFQVARVARERHLSEDKVRDLVRQATRGRDLGILGEPRVNVLELNLSLEALSSH